MRIKTVWGVRKHTPDEPELMVAWDEHCVDGNPEGYEEDVKKAVASWGEDLYIHRVVLIDVPDQAIFDAFKPPVVKATTPVTLEHSKVTLTNTHPVDRCEGESCTIHNRSDHSMRAFPQHWREDRGIMERICPHGVGHPDPDSPWHPDSAEWLHGCDGCCRP